VPARGFFFLELKKIFVFFPGHAVANKIYPLIFYSSKKTKTWRWLTASVEEPHHRTLKKQFRKRSDYDRLIFVLFLFFCVKKVSEDMAAWQSIR
jgi:hypothetical protein